MNRQKFVLMAVAVALMAGTAGLLARVGTDQRLSAPGVKTRPSTEPGRLEVELPPQVLDCKSEFIPVDDITKGALPPDTSFGERRYEAPDGFAMMLNVVLMGSDRTSLHKPQFCLTGQGWRIDDSGTLTTSIPVERPFHYDLPVVRLVASRQATVDGRPEVIRAIYVYWFVADDALSASVSGFQRMWMMGSKLLRTGVLQRWAYVSCLSICRPGEEEAAFARMKKLIAAAAPGFQTYPSARTGTIAGESAGGS